MPDTNLKPFRLFRRLTLIFLGAALMAFNLNTFVHAGGLIPGGFTGLALLVQQIFLRYLNIHVPFSVLLYTFNAVPAVVCFKYVGKKFTLYSVLVVFLTGIFTDFMPSMFIEHIQLHDTLLSSVFGGILNAFSIILCLYAGATSGGTDFIAIFISEKFRKDAWNYIFIGNCFILIFAGYLFDLEKALYSVIFQFTSTMVLNSLYRDYQQKTLLIITDHFEEVYKIIHDKTHHSVTSVTVQGMFKRQDRHLLYSVVYSNEVTPLTNAIRAVDPDAFINIIKTEQINGKFYKRPRD